MSWALKTTGLPETLAALQALPAEVTGPLMKRAMSGPPATILVDGAARRAPHRTGELEAAIVFEITQEGPRTTCRVGPGPKGKTKGWYGKFSEYGTKHEPARPWLRPTLDEDGAAAVTALSQEVAKGLETAAARLHRARGRA